MEGIMKIFFKKAAPSAAEKKAEKKASSWKLWESKSERLQVRIDLLESAAPEGYHEGKCLWCGSRHPYKGTRFCLICGIDLAAMSDEGFQLVLKNFEILKNNKPA